jgi:RNA polymerase sigma-70 factor (ECF subfamily)
MTGLSGTDQEVIALACADDLSDTEAAVILGISPDAFRKRLERARKRLKKRLADEWEAIHAMLTD